MGLAVGRSIIRIAMKRDIPALIAAMAEQVDLEDAQRTALSALGIMSIFDKKGAIVQAGGLEAICGGMKAHPLRKEVQREGCGALVNLAAADDNKRRIVKAKGVQVIVRAMGQFRSDINIQHWGCWALNSLANLDEHKVCCFPPAL